MTDIRIATDFPYHTKTVRLIHAIGPEAVTHLLKLWCFARINNPDGDLSNRDDVDIEIAAGWQGERGEFVAAIRSEKTRFLDADNSLHDWEEHQQWAMGAQQRKEKARKAAKKRWSDATSNATSNAPSTATGNAPIPSSPIPSSPIPSLPITKTVKKAKTFVRPTYNEVSEYCQKKSYTFDPEQFIAHYESNGWKVGKNAMKSWQSACVTWQKREKGTNSKPTLSSATQAGLRALQRISEVENNGQLRIGKDSNEDF